LRLNDSTDINPKRVKLYEENTWNTSHVCWPDNNDTEHHYLYPHDNQIAAKDQFTLTCLLYFDEASRPHQELLLNIGEPLRNELEKALDPILKRLNVRPRPKFVRWVTKPQSIIQILAASLVLMLLYLFLKPVIDFFLKS
jgi:hypothetical protein